MCTQLTAIVARRDKKQFTLVEHERHFIVSFAFLVSLETYSPQVIVKTRVDRPIPSNDYALQCNTRGNPLPRLLWSKVNGSLDYFPTVKLCQKPCRIYSVQNK